MWKGAVKKGQTDVISVTMHFVMQAIYRSMWQITAVKGQTIVTSMNMHLFVHAIWKKHFKTQWRKSNKCNQCNYESSQGWNLKTPFKIHSGEKPKNATNVAMPPLNQVIRGNVWKGTVEKNNQTSVTSVTLHPCGQTPWRNTWKCTLKFDIKKTN